MQIGPFRLLQSLPNGIYGSVFQAEHITTGVRAAVQIFNGPGRADERAVQALQEHLQTLHKLDLPGTPRPLDCGRTEAGHLYLITSWLQGQCLQIGQPAVAHALRLAQQVAASLEEAHQHGIYHLMLRPSQILVSMPRRQGPRCAVLGLGLAGLLGPPGATLSATQLSFLAPERRGGGVAASSPGAADVYSLGMLVRVLLGLSIKGNLTELASAADLLGSAALSTALGQLLQQVLARDPEQRPSMAAVNSHLYEMIQSRRRRLVARSDGSAAQPGEPAPGADAVALLTQTHRTLPLRAAAPLAVPAEQGDPLIGQVFGKFILVRQLGSGAMGTVYEARHQLIEHRAAVKVLRPQLAADHEYARRFMDEARAVNIVAHPSLVSIFDFGQREDGLLYIVMEFLRGETLDAALARGPLSQSTALPLGLQCARALAAAHERAVVHRDFKPGNVMLVPDPLLPATSRIKLLDFGIAKVAPHRPDGADQTQADLVMGTPRYMAPEQYRNAAGVNGKADVFALGVVLFEMLTGRSPFGDAASFAVLLAAPSAEPLWRAGVPRAIGRAIIQMMAKDAHLRPSMTEVVTWMEGALDRRRALHWRLPLLGALLGVAAAVLILIRPPSVLSLQRQQAAVRARALAVLQSAVRASEEPVRVAAIQSLGSLRDAAPVEQLVALTRDPSAAVAAAAIAALAELPGARAGEQLASLLSDRDRQRQLWAALALAQAGSQPRRLREQARRHLRQFLQALPERDERASLSRLEIAAALYTSAEALPGDTAAQAGELARSRELAWEALAASGLAESARLSFLESWAQLGDAGAQSQLARLAAQRQDQAVRLRAIAGQLTQHGSTAAQRAELVAVARTTGPLQLLAARLLAPVEGEAGCKILARLARQQVAAKQEQQAAAQLRLAADGLAFCELEQAQELLPLLDGARGPATLQVLAARSLLRVVGLDPERSAQLQLDAIAPYLNSSTRSDRLTAIALLAILPGEQGVAELGAALHDPDELVRSASATALGQRRLLSSLNTLTSSLADANTSVRQSGLRAIAQLLDALKPASGSGLSHATVTELRRRLSQPLDAAERIIVQMVLVRCGEPVSRKELEAVLELGSEQHRLLLVELLPGDSPLLKRALKDASAKVRFFAARRRVAQRSRDAVPVLTEMLERPGEEAILSYWMLRQLGMSPQAPAQLAEFLQGSSLATRRDAVLLLGELSVREALPYLLKACADPAEVVRGAVAESAWRLYEKTPDPRLFELLSRLSTDPELPVRMKALAFFGRLASSPAATRAVSADPPREPAREPPRERDLRDLARERDLARDTGDSDAAARDVAAPPAPAPPAPPSQERADGGAAPVDKAAHTVLRPASGTGRLESQRADLRPLLQEARQARRRGDFSVAQNSVERALKSLDRTHSPELYDLLRFESGEIKAASGRLREALGDWSAVWERYRGSPPREVPSIDGKFGEMRSRVGRLTVYNLEGAKCNKVFDGLLMPGDGQKMTLGKARLVFDIKPGVSTVKNLCGAGLK